MTLMADGSIPHRQTFEPWLALLLSDAFLKSIESRKSLSQHVSFFLRSGDISALLCMAHNTNKGQWRGPDALYAVFYRCCRCCLFGFRYCWEEKKNDEMQLKQPKQRRSGNRARFVLQWIARHCHNSREYNHIDWQRVLIIVWISFLLVHLFGWIHLFVWLVIFRGIGTSFPCFVSLPRFITLIEVVE